jgi:prepilin-type N-terminal cleavage/methylation domain-containing protein
MKRKGLTLMEIIVSVVILALVVTGLINIFIAGRRHILHTRLRMTATELGRYFLDPLQMQVRQDTWNDLANCLGTGNCPNQTAGPAEGLDRNFTANYTANVSYLGTNLTKIRANITWNETSP